MTGRNKKAGVRKAELPLQQEAIELSNQIIILHEAYNILKKDIVFDISWELNKRFDQLEIELRRDLRLSEILENLEKIRERKNIDSYQ